MKSNLLLSLSLLLSLHCFGVEVKIVQQYEHFSGRKIQRTVLAENEIQPNKEAMEKLYRRFGNDDYDALKKDILCTLPEMKYPGSVVAAARIFREAYDADALFELFEALDPRQVPDDDSWRQLELHCTEMKNDRVSESYLLKCPSIYTTSCWNSFFSDMVMKKLEDGTITPRLRTAIRRLMEFSPHFYASLVCYFPEEQPVYARLNAVLEQKKDGTERRQSIERMRCLIGKAREKALTPEQTSEFRKFTELLDKDKAEELMDYIRVCEQLKSFKEAIPYLEKWQEQEFSEYELHYPNMVCSMYHTPEMAKEFMTEYRRNTLISFLLQGEMAAEAQKTAEKYYGKEVDLNRFRRMDFHLLGAVQSASGHRFFQAKLEQREVPQNDGIDFFREKVQYYHGRKEPQKILKVYEEAIEHGRKTNAIELVVWGMTQKAHHAWSASPPDRQKALELARQAWEEVAEITLENSGQKYERIQARNDATVTYMNMCEELRPSEMDKIFRREAKDGFYFYGRSYVMRQFRKNRSFSLSASDSVFKNINDPSFQKKHGFQSGLHEIRLMTVPVKTLIGKDFQSCLEQAVSDFNDAKAELSKRNSSGESWPSFLASIYFDGKDGEIKKALVAKCLHDEFQQKHYLITSLPARSYDEGKRLLELAWKNNELPAPERIQGLRHLMKTAVSATERQWCAEQLRKFNIQQ